MWSHTSLTPTGAPRFRSPRPIALGFFVQYLLASRARRWQLDDLKREAYAEFLRSISASFSQAYYGEGKSEDASLLKATAVIERLAEPDISKLARALQQQVDCTHRKLRSEGPDAAEDDMQDTALIEKFKRIFKSPRESRFSGRSPELGGERYEVHLTRLPDPLPGWRRGPAP
jgi:hypothetical protein